MNRKRACTNIAAFATALAVGGCGGSGSSSALTHTQLVSQAEAICQRIDGAILRLSARKPEEPVKTLAEEAKLKRAELAGLEKLDPPSTPASQWKRLLAATRATADDVGTYDEYVRTNNEKAAPALVKSLHAAEEAADSAAKEIGLHYCRRIG